MRRVLGKGRTTWGFIVAPVETVGVLREGSFRNRQAIAGVTWPALTQSIRPADERAPEQREHSTIFDLMDAEAERRGDGVGALAVLDIGRLATPTQAAEDLIDIPPQWLDELADPLHSLRPWEARDGAKLDQAAVAVFGFKQA